MVYIVSRINNCWYRPRAKATKYLMLLYPGQVKGKSCVEIGSGPTVYTSVTASKFCDTIVISDFLESNRHEVELWLKNDARAFDWKHVLQYFAIIEGFSDLDEGVSQIEARLRSKIKDVVHCDVTQNFPLGKGMEYFDVVITSACLEAATSNPKDYASAIKNLTPLLDSGGKLVMVGFLNGTWYTVKNIQFPLVSLNKELICNSLRKAGFVIEMYKEKDITECLDCDSNRCFFCLSTKK